MKSIASKRCRSAKGWASMWLLGCALASAAHGQAARYPVTPEQIVAAMQGLAWPVAGVRVTLAAPMTAAVADPRLAIQTASMITPREARIRIACRAPGACLPFFATALWPGSAAPVSLPANRAEVETLTAGAEHHSAHELRAGTSALLVLDSGRIHIQVQVICLEAGNTGDKIRVSTRDRKQAYVAEVVSPTLLKGSL